MPSHAFLGAGASYSCHLAEDAYSAVARAGARWNCVAHNLSPDSAQGGIPADQGWNSTPSRVACAPCMGGTSERSNAPVSIATPHLKCSTFLRVKLPSSASLVGSKRWCTLKLQRPLSSRPERCALLKNHEIAGVYQFVMKRSWTTLGY